MKETHARAADSSPREPLGFRHLLQSELARRCASNSKYSLRAFAKHLDVDHSTLSQLLRKRRRLTGSKIEELGSKLGLSPEEIRRHVAIEEALRAHETSGDRLTEIQQLTRDAASLLSDWYHYALLELVRLEEFRPETRWISRVLGISPDEVNVAVARLCHLGLLEMRGRHWEDRCGDAMASLEGFAEATLDRLFGQIRALSLRAIEDTPSELRDHTSTTLAINTARLPSVLELITNFRRHLIELLERDPERDDVYQLEVSFFPVTKLSNGREAHDGRTGNALADRDEES